MKKILQNTFAPALLLTFVDRALSWLAGRPLAGTLSLVLDHQPQAIKMVAEKRDGLMQELLFAHPEIARTAAVGSLPWTLLFLPLSWLILYHWISLSPVQVKAGKFADNLWLRALSTGLAGLGLYVAPILLAGLLVWAGGHWFSSRDFEFLASYAGMAGLVLGQVWTMTAVLVAYLFAVRGASLDVTLGRAIRQAVQMAWLRRGQTLLLAALLLLGLVVMHLVSWWTVEKLPVTVLGQTATAATLFATTLVRKWMLCGCYFQTANSWEAIDSKEELAGRLSDLELNN